MTRQARNIPSLVVHDGDRAALSNDQTAARNALPNSSTNPHYGGGIEGETNHPSVAAERGEPTERPVTTMDPEKYLDAKLETERARTDARFSEMLAEMKASNAALSGEVRALTGHLEGLTKAIDGRLEGMSSRIDSLPGMKAHWAGVAATIFAVVGLMLAALSWGNDQFGVGVSVSPIQAQIERSDARLEAIEKQTAATNEAVRAIAGRLPTPAQ